MSAAMRGDPPFIERSRVFDQALGSGPLHEFIGAGDASCLCHR